MYISFELEKWNQRHSKKRVIKTKLFYRYDKIYKSDKVFHVSPFNNVIGEYLFFVKLNNEDTAINFSIIIKENGEKKLMALVKGESSELNTMNLIFLLYNFGFNAFLTFPRILFKAASLHYVRYLKIYNKPEPNSKSIIKRNRPNIIERQKFNIHFLDIVLIYF